MAGSMPEAGESSFWQRKSMVEPSRVCLWCFKGSRGVMSPTSDSAMSWIRAMRVQCGMLRREEREGGARRVRIDMRYMWSDIDSGSGWGVSEVWMSPVEISSLNCRFCL